MPSRRQFIKVSLATASMGAALKLSAGCTPIIGNDRSANLSKTSTYNVLCCDGGGLKGLITARILTRLEEKLKDRFPNKPQIRDHFSLIAGTSTGSIIACGLAQGISAEQIVQFYKDKADAIFPSSTGLLRLFVTDQLKQLPTHLEQVLNGISWIIEQSINVLSQTINQLFKRIIQADFSLPILEREALNLEQILQTIFKSDPNTPSDPSLQELTLAVVTVAYDAFNRKPLLLSNLPPQPGEADTRKVKIWEACRASAAVPGIFPSYVLAEETLLNSIVDQNYGAVPQEVVGLPLVDGSVVANNPSLWAIQKARQVTQGKGSIFVASFGTGQALSSTSPKKIVKWGLLDWFNPFQGIPMLEVMLSGNSVTVDNIARQLLEDTDHYLRCQPNLNQLGFQTISAFTSDKDNLEKMEQAALAYLANGGEAKLDELIQRLA